MPCNNASTAGSSGLGGLKDMIAEDALNVFCNTSDFAETVVYYPRNNSCGGNPRSIDAVVMREQIEVVTEDGNTTNLAIWQVHVANNTTLGISSKELDLGGDMLAFSPRDGKPAEKKSILRILSQDNGMLELECR